MSEKYNSISEYILELEGSEDFYRNRTLLCYYEDQINRGKSVSEGWLLEVAQYFDNLVSEIGQFATNFEYPCDEDDLEPDDDLQ